jgi:primosomal protein N' (replication factor Y)
MGSWYADVILPLPLEGLFTYSLTNEQAGFAKPGIRVTVQVGAKKLYTGLIHHVHQQQPAVSNLKPVLSLLDNEPVVNSIQLSLWNWIAGYYVCPPGEIYKAALPAGFRLESETLLYLRREIKPDDNPSDDALPVIKMLEKNNYIALSSVQKRIGQADIIKLLKPLIEKGLVGTEESIRKAYKPKIVDFIRLNPDLNDEYKLHSLLDNLQKYPGQHEAVVKFLDLSSLAEKTFSEGIEKAFFINKFSKGRSAIKTLIKKGIFEIYQQQVTRIPLTPTSLVAPVILNANQQKALDQIRKGFEEKDVVLLHGITSSGKTEIYIHLMKETMDKGMQVLYLLPEIALTTQIILRLRKVFGNKVGIYHSKFSDNERIEIWNYLLCTTNNPSGQYQLIVGVRSSVFLPFTKLGLVIIDEEHENTFKQYDPAPRYHARDTAIVLARLHRAKVLLGSATPSLESYYNVISGKYSLVELTSRYLDVQLPEINIVDLREAYRRKQMRSHFSEQLLNEMRVALSHGERVILFQNRRGFSIYLECADCGRIPQCKNCNVSMTYHKRDNKLICHYCGYTSKIPAKCAYCGSSKIQMRGFGTEKIEDEIAVFFPDARIARMDMDTTRSKTSYERILSEFEAGGIDILVGTQMISKGLDFENVSLVGILNADNMLNYPDFRAYERSFQLMLQVSGRAGRKSKRGKVIIQTFDSKNELYQLVKQHDYASFARLQLAERKHFNYPPYARIIEILMKHRKNNIVRESAKYFVQKLREHIDGQVLGPESPFVDKVKNFYLQRILIKIEKEKSVVKVKETIKNAVKNLNKNAAYKAVMVAVDVDPY